MRVLFRLFKKVSVEYSLRLDLFEVKLIDPLSSSTNASKEWRNRQRKESNRVSFHTDQLELMTL